MGKRYTAVQPLFSFVSFVRRARGATGIAFSVALLLACSGKSETDSNGGAGDSGSNVAGRSSSSGGGVTGSSGGGDVIAGPAGRGGEGNVDGNSGGAAGRGIISAAGRGGLLGRAGSSGAGNLADTSFGFACTGDAQCGNGMVCAAPASTLFGTGGPSNGMCTLACDVAGTDCDSLKAGASCFNFGTSPSLRGYCLDSCTLGTATDLTAKCAGRPDFACTDLGSTLNPHPFCVPHCRSDAECGSGLYCDKSGPLGLCKTTKHAGDPIGTACNPGTASDPGPQTCAAYCLRTSDTNVTPPTGVCAELCSAGSECMYGLGPNPAPGGFCGGAFTDSPGPIDLGYCLPNCSCSSDCKFPGDLCRKWSTADADLQSALGAPGVCFPTVAQSLELTCNNGGAGGAGAGGASTGGAGAGGASTGGASTGGAGASGSAGTPSP